jgi:tetratricopeptide (TPR) repeat protein
MGGAKTGVGRHSRSRPQRWKLAGIVAALGLALSVALNLAVRPVRRPPAPAAQAHYVGSERCRSCHAAAYGKWKGSHHGLAMQSAREGTVLGDFHDVTFEHRGKQWRFLLRGEEFLVRAEGPDGALHEYEVAYTFGVDPLQQFLVPFPGGRLQCLPVAWNTRARRWFFLYPGQDIPPTDWLHWTRQGQTWNTMCADCHSTAVRKRYDPGTDTFQTTWSEISVGCEACHGPGSLHAAWAGEAAGARAQAKDDGLVLRASKLQSRELVELCAPCHSRRAQFADQGLPGGELLDRYLPSLLSPGLFHPDGQILEEDYEYHSFLQSKMYANGVRCTDCHDAHSGEHQREGNALCTRCHDAGTHDTRAHHFHQPLHHGTPSAGALCTSCHMPGRYYMVVHFRRDHSLRVPRPDLSAAIGVPNACSAAGCHADKPLSWVTAKYDAWFGRTRRPHYGTILAAGRRGSPGAQVALAQLAQDPSRPAVVRATALELLGGDGSEASAVALERGLADPDPLLRHTAASHLRLQDPVRLVRALAPLLEDPVRGVRIAAAARLFEVPSQLLTGSQGRARAAALDEYVESQRFMSDMPSGPFNLGNLYASMGRAGEAEQQYRRAIDIDDKCYPAKANLGLLLGQQGRRDEAERLLREVHAAQPRIPGVAFNLGLLLAEQGKTDEAEEALRTALSSDPTLAAAAYNLAVLVGPRRPSEAVNLLRRAARLRPDEPRYAWSLALFLTKTNDPAGAIATLEALLRSHPADGDAYLLLGETYEHQGRWSDAQDLYARAQRVEGLPVEVRAALASRARQIGNGDGRANPGGR